MMNWLARLERARASLQVGDPRTPGVLVGPLVDEAAFDAMQAALAQARDQGGTVAGGERVAVGGKDTRSAMPGMPRPPWCACRRRRRWSATRPSRPSSTC
jgi:aldehyde dehydrogenase (NAD+)